MGRVVILEGPDGGGKTSLARKLEKLGFEYKHEGPPPENVDLVAHYLNILNESIESDGDVVHDRLWLGERIYGPIARGADRLGLNGQKLFTRLCSSKGVLQLICLPTLGITLENYSHKIKEAHDYLKNVEKLKEVYVAYLQWFDQFASLGNIDSFDYRFNDEEFVLNHFRLLESSSPKGMVGSKRARYLFIGDKPNHPSIDVPFHALNGSSGYFNNALLLAGLQDWDVAISNAYSPTNKPHILASMISWLPKLEHIFVMGKSAQNWFERNASLGICKVSFIDHPSYLKRFKGSNPMVMAEILKEAICGISG